MIIDKNSNVIEIGDIVRIEGSPNKSDNATYIVAQDGTSEFYSGSDLTLYKVAKHKNGYTLSRCSYNICFYPLVCYSNKYKYTRDELNRATIEILIKNDPEKVEIIKNDNNYEEEEKQAIYFRCNIETVEGKDIEDISFLEMQVKKLQAFLSNISLKTDEIINIIKCCNTDFYYRTSEYKAIYRTETKEEEQIILEKVQTIEEEISTDINNLVFEVAEDIDTRTNEKVYLVKVMKKLNREEYIKVNKYIKSLGGYYSKSKHAFLFKESPTTILNLKANIEEGTEHISNKEIKEKECSFEIKEDVHTKTREKLWIVNPDKELSKADLAVIKRKFATIQGYYSSLKKAFIFKYDPTEKITTP
jgi:hypothetical protein